MVGCGMEGSGTHENNFLFMNFKFIHGSRRSTTSATLKLNNSLKHTYSNTTWFCLMFSKQLFHEYN